MKTVTVDVRGTSKVPALCKKYLENHSKIAEDINLVMVNNQDVDIVVWENDIPLQFFEIKIGDDLPNSLNTMQLHKEMREYSLMSAQYEIKTDIRPTIYLICMGIYDYETYARLIGLMSEKWNWVKVHMPYRTDTGIKKVFDLIKSPEQIENYYMPTLIANEVKGFVLSIQSLVHGVSLGLAMYLSQRLHISDEECDIERYISDYYEDGKKHSALAKKIFDQRKKTWLREYEKYKEAI